METAMSPHPYTKFLSVEAIAMILGLAIAGQALHKSHRYEDYDPSSQITLALTVMAGGWIIPTRKLDQQITNAIAPVNPDITHSTADKAEELEE